MHEIIHKRIHDCGTPLTGEIRSERPAEEGSGSERVLPVRVRIERQPSLQQSAELAAIRQIDRICAPGHCSRHPPVGYLRCLSHLSRSERGRPPTQRRNIQNLTGLAGTRYPPRSPRPAPSGRFVDHAQTFRDSSRSFGPGTRTETGRLRDTCTCRSQPPGQIPAVQIPRFRITCTRSFPSHRTSSFNIHRGLPLPQTERTSVGRPVNIGLAGADNASQRRWRCVGYER
jgi:hypothetical protein